MSKIVFGTDGWRGLIARDFTFDNVNLVSKAIGLYIRDTYRNKPVVIGYDTRFLAYEFAMEVSSVLNSMGFNTLVSKNPIPTPVIAYAAMKYDTGGAIMLTASHNPPEYCGIKYIPDYAGPATPEITDEIVSNVQLYQDGSLKFKEAETKGKTEFFDPKKDYFDFIKNLLNMEKLKDLNLKVAYDPLYATGMGYVDTFLTENTKCEVTSIHNFKDPLFGGGMPEPAEKYLGELKETIKNNNCAVGLANDGDSDRFGVVDENGTYYTPNQVISLLLRHLVKNKGFKGSVVRTLATTHLLDKLVKKYDLKLIETPVGFKYVGAQMRETDVVIGGEESGGLSILGHIPEKDGVLADLLIVEMMAYENKSLSQIWEDLVNEIGYAPNNKRLDLHLNDEHKKYVMNLFRNNTPQELAGLKLTGVKTIDGVKMLFEDTNSWVLVRPSGTEPLIRVYIETDSVEKLARFEEEITNLLPKA
ncbi:MAG: phosphoglucomutase/phosphomannomutase family protein [Candidatus Sericytochromatia bacterium]